MKCIFCLSDGPFNTKEHIIPISLGNDDDILDNGLCDKCQNYFGKEIESYILSKSPFAFWRVLYRLKNREGRIPEYNTTLPEKKKGNIPNYHPDNDQNITFKATDSYDNQVLEIDSSDVYIKKLINNGKKNSVKVVITPYMLIMIGRFLGKMAIEFYYSEVGENVFSEKYNSLRNYVRYGTQKNIWPILHCNLITPLHDYYPCDENSKLESCIIYQYGLFHLKKHDVDTFIFDIGNERYGILLNNVFPERDIIESLIDDDGNKLRLIHYSEYKNLTHDKDK
jgi:hypothetical protein